MLDLIIRIVDRFISLIKERECFNRSSYDDFVAPIMGDFETLHVEYLKFFEAYRARINETNFPISCDDPLIKDIKRDVLFNVDALSKLRVLKSDEKDPLLGRFIKSILDYVNCSGIDPCSGIEIKIEGNAEDIYPEDRIHNEYLGNVYRGSLIRYFEQKKEEQDRKTQNEMRDQATMELDNIVSLLQTHYRNVLEQHHRLKRKLLKII